MKIVLTGSTGFLGSVLLRKLLIEKHELIIVKRASSSLKRIHDLLERVEIVNLDEIDLNSFFSNKNIDALINTACCYGRNKNSIKTIVEANTLFPLELLQICKSNNIFFINTGSYLDSRINEYSLSKHQFQQWLKFYKDECDSVTITFDYLYGPGDDSTKFTNYLLDKFSNDEFSIDLTSGEQTRNFIHIFDAADVFLKVLEKMNSFKGYNEIIAGSNETIKMKKFIILLKKIWNKHATHKCSTQLNFGAVNYREYEVMETVIDDVFIGKELWLAKIKLENGLIDYVKCYCKDNS